MKNGILLFMSALFFIIFLPITILVLLWSILCYWVGRWADNYHLQRYGFYLAYSYDQFANTAVFMGSPNETISSRLARAIEGGNPRWFVKGFAMMVDFLAVIVSGEKEHIKNSLEKHRHIERELVSWTRP